METCTLLRILPVFPIAMSLLVLCQRAQSEELLETAMQREPPPHAHLKYYGYHLIGDLDDFRDEIRELATYTNFISFSAHEIHAAQLEGLSPEERKARFKQAAEKVRFIKSLGMDLVFANMAIPLMRLEDTREPWLAWLRELRDEMGEEMKLITAFYIVDEPDLWDMEAETVGQWIAEFKSVFPDVKVVSTYAVVARSQNLIPPENLDYVAIDPYINFPVEDPAEDFILQYDIRFRQALKWVRECDRPAFMVADAAVSSKFPEKNPMSTLHDCLWFFYLSLAEERIQGLIWWYYGNHTGSPEYGNDGFRLGAFPETEKVHRDIGRALLGIGKEPNWPFVSEDTSTAENVAIPETRAK